MNKTCNYNFSYKIYGRHTMHMVSTQFCHVCQKTPPALDTRPRALQLQQNHCFCDASTFHLIDLLVCWAAAQKQVAVNGTRQCDFPPPQFLLTVMSNLS